MSQYVSNSFVTKYVADVHQAYQRRGSMLASAVRRQDSVIGSTAIFQRVGKGTATTKGRHGIITPMNQTHTPVTATIEDFYAPDYVDKLDEHKININEYMVIAEGGAAALGRKVDDQVMTVLDSTTQTVITITVTAAIAVHSGLLTAVKSLWANDVPNDGQCYAIISPTLWARAMQVKEFSSADWVGANGLPHVEGAPIGRWKDWMNVKWQMHSGTSGAGTSAAKGWVWHKNAVGYASGAVQGNVAGSGGPVGATIDWVPDRAAHLVNNWMAGGAVMIEDAGVIEFTSDDTTALPTS